MQPHPLEGEHVLVIGASTLDLKGRPEHALTRGSSVEGVIRTSIGGVARNIAENLARLDVNPVLLTAVGNDGAGERILGHATASGIDTSHALVIDDLPSGTYMAILTEAGALDFGMADMHVLEALTPDYLSDHWALFKSARMAVIDANLSEAAISTVIRLCEDYDVPLCADPTSTSLAPRLRPHLSQLLMMAPNTAEASIMVETPFDLEDREATQLIAQQLVSRGLKIAVITMSEHGVVYADGETKGYIPALKTQLVDQTGAGDAMSAGIIFGLLEGIPIDESVRLGVTAASLTLRTKATVRPDLSVELLYDELVY
ncbi:MAG: ribokinase [Chloroflexi bacterium]|nr:ribokinase [Chloroflexota bacterium]